jgi:hypothetical protein
MFNAEIYETHYLAPTLVHYLKMFDKRYENIYEFACVLVDDPYMIAYALLESTPWCLGNSRYVVASNDSKGSFR